MARQLNLKQFQNGSIGFEQLCGVNTEPMDDNDVGFEGVMDADEESEMLLDSPIEDSPRGIEDSPAGSAEVPSGPRDGDNIRVFVRVRPANAREGSSRDVVRVDAPAGAVHLMAETPKNFTFDGVLGEASTQEEVFSTIGTGIGDACLSGYNGSLYVYGQTGSGKTYTMQGTIASVQSMHSEERRGIMCRLLENIFSEISKRHQTGSGVQYACKCSYLEIYKEQITDLLEPSAQNLQVREDINRGIYVERLTEQSVWTVSDAYHVLWKGLHQRHVGATHMNEKSSRSHSVFTLVLEATSTTAGGVTSTRVARLNLIDLAGSERQSFDPHSSGTHESVRVKEAGAINKSLSALTNVIMSLSQGRRRSSVGAGANAKSRSPFVRYRDSKLTFLLRDSLGGNSKTVIVACVSPSGLNFGESLSTLKFAARAKHIRCAAVMNEEYSGTVESLMLEVKSLKQQLELLSSRGLISRSANMMSQASLATLPCGMQQGATNLEADMEDDELFGNFLVNANSEMRRLYGPRRVRRLEILLAAALERERRCDIRRHKLDKFTQYLNALLERKENYFDALRQYFTLLVDHAAGEALYLPELTARLVVFRQQLGSASMDDDSRRQAADMLDGAIEAIAGKDEDGVQDPQSVLGVSSSVRELGAPGSLYDNEARNRSYSYGVLMGEAALRNNRRGSSKNLRSNMSGKALHNVTFGESLASPSASTADLTTPRVAANTMETGSTGCFSSASMGNSGLASGARAALGGLSDEELSALREENKLLRRLVEGHPELHRLTAENRLLREHLASLAQQHALARADPSWSKGKTLAQQVVDEQETVQNACLRAKGVAEPSPESSRGLSHERSLARTSKSSLLAGSAVTASAQRQKVAGSSLAGGGSAKIVGFGEMLGSRPFPGIEDATQISPSSSSAGSDTEEPEKASGVRETKSGSRSGALAAQGAADATAFLPKMAKEVEELVRIKAGLEESIQQTLRRRRSANVESKVDASPVSSPARSCASSNTAIDIDPRVATEIYRGTSEALNFAEGMLAKGRGETLLLTVGGGQDSCGYSTGKGASPFDGATEREGLDERDVFMSLMRSLPNDGPALGRSGSANSGLRLGGVGDARGGSGFGSASTRLLRNRSTRQLHRIAEGPASPTADTDGIDGVPSAGPDMFNIPAGLPKERMLPVRVESTPSKLGAPTESGSGALPSSASELLRETAQKGRQLCSNLEQVDEAYRRLREQIQPLQDEYRRRGEECRFLESQYKRLTIHCRLLDERATTMDTPGTAARPQLKQGATSPATGVQAIAARFQNSNTSTGLSQVCSEIGQVLGRTPATAISSNVVATDPSSRSAATAPYASAPCVVPLHAQHSSSATSLTAQAATHPIGQSSTSGQPVPLAQVRPIPKQASASGTLQQSPSIGHTMPQASLSSSQAGLSDESMRRVSSAPHLPIFRSMPDPHPSTLLRGNRAEMARTTSTSNATMSTMYLVSSPSGTGLASSATSSSAASVAKTNAAAQFSAGSRALNKSSSAVSMPGMRDRLSGLGGFRTGASYVTTSSKAPAHQVLASSATQPIHNR